MLEQHDNIIRNPNRDFLINKSLENRDAISLKTGTLATWTPTDSSGRSPKDTLTVQRKANIDTIDWDSPYNIPISEGLFDDLLEDAITILENENEVFVTDRAIGADEDYCLPVTTITSKALTQVFADNMFRPLGDVSKSLFGKKPFMLVVLPDNRLDKDKYAGRLRIRKSTGETSDMAIAFDYERRIGIVFGSKYMGSVKKMMFTVMNYYLVFENILPLHCSANEGKDKDVALFLGLSGTGKTTLSTTPDRKLIGDDEHGWSKNGIANFENGCYAKLIRLNSEKEPDIYKACFSGKDIEKNGAIVENVMAYPNGEFDLYDGRLAENSRGSYPLSFINNIKKNSKGGQPKTILFLTADANGVLPPISKLGADQAMFWYLMGYTSKLAGTETDIIEPVTTFSRFFGAPFMPANPSYYLEMLKEKIESCNTSVFLVNTGWSGGEYGRGKRIDLTYTRAMVKAALNGDLDDVDYFHDDIFHLDVPKSCPGIENSDILNPVEMWENQKDFFARAYQLAAEFRTYFNKNFINKVSEEVKRMCP